MTMLQHKPTTTTLNFIIGSSNASLALKRQTEYKNTQMLFKLQKVPGNTDSLRHKGDICRNKTQANRELGPIPRH